MKLQIAVLGAVAVILCLHFTAAAGATHAKKYNCPKKQCSCLWGVHWHVDKYGCRYCRCAKRASSPRCPKIDCHNKYCSGGYLKDDRGCPTCHCIRICPKLHCKQQCYYGYIKDKYDCQTCECKCPHHQCARVCPHGYVKDAHGCPTCACLSPPGYECPLFNCPAGECLKGYRYSTDLYGCHRPLFCSEYVCNVYCAHHEYFRYETQTCKCACAAGKNWLVGWRLR